MASEREQGQHRFGPGHDYDWAEHEGLVEDSSMCLWEPGHVEYVSGLEAEPKKYER